MKSLRIISGTARGRHIYSVPGDVTRPITDRVKEALFDILGGDIVGSAFLDLFAGTGSVGIEALSRGADFACLIDNNRRAYETILKNLELTILREKAVVMHIDAFIFLKQPITRKFDYIYVAPPQYKQLWSKAMQVLDEQPDHLSPEGWIIAQINPIEYKSLELTNFKEFDQRKYGDTQLVFLQAI